MRGLPVVVVPVSADEAALDACLHALDAATPAGTRVWLADDAQAGPRGVSLIERWLPRTRLRADYTRRTRSIGECAHLSEVLKACGDANVAVLAADAQPAPGWLEALADVLADASIASATPWSNAGETASFPRLGQVAPMPLELPALARACHGLTETLHELPAAVSHAVLLRGSAVRGAGGLDTATYASWPAALTDLCLRLAGLGWRNVLCAGTYVARPGEAAVAAGDGERLAARWPDWHARLAHALMADPLYHLRERLAQRQAAQPAPHQAQLFETGAGQGTHHDTRCGASSDAACA